MPAEDYSAAEVTQFAEDNDLIKPPVPHAHRSGSATGSGEAGVAARKSEDKGQMEGGMGKTMPPLPFIVRQQAGRVPGFCGSQWIHMYDK